MKQLRVTNARCGEKLTASTRAAGCCGITKSLIVVVTNATRRQDAHVAYVVARSDCSQAHANVVAATAGDIDNQVARALADHACTQELKRSSTIKAHRVIPRCQPPRCCTRMHNRRHGLIRLQTTYVAIRIPVDGDRATVWRIARRVTAGFAAIKASRQIARNPIARTFHQIDERKLVAEITDRIDVCGDRAGRVATR